MPNEASATSLNFLSEKFSSSPVEHTVGLLAEMRPDDGLYALVLDDTHLITNGEIIKSLPAVLKRLPRSFVTLILSRREIPDEYRPLIKNEADIIGAALLAGQRGLQRD
jgi:LuxR family maltose regulon positive regulatory protein